MDARNLLRRYLEQRRELGESELVLDGMSVGEVMKILGATGHGHPERSEGSARAVDWRSALREAGAAPTEKKGHRFEAPANAAAAPVAETPEGITIGSQEPAYEPIPELASLDAIAQTVAECRRCPLYASATKPVPGEGNPNADLVCVGEAPGENEDLEGRPFVGASGQLLTKILAAIELKRDEVFICNVLKHRPPGNRNPAPEEIAACSPYLVRQIQLIRPKVILAFGKFAAQTLLETDLSLGALRSKIHRYHGVPLIATYHPAALLRNSSWKRPAWEDVQLARRILDRASPLGPRA